MSETGYTVEFWTRATMLQNARLKICEKCFRKNGEEITNFKVKRKPKHRSFVEVRVALRIGRRIHPDNLGLFCTKCRRARVVRMPKLKPEEMMEPLFGT